MPDKKDIEEELKKQTGFYIDLARGYLDDLRNSINSCDIIGAFPIFRDIHSNTERARRHSSDLSPATREGIYPKISSVEAESFSVIDSIPTKCDCKKKPEEFTLHKEEDQWWFSSGTGKLGPYKSESEAKDYAKDFGIKYSKE